MNEVERIIVHTLTHTSTSKSYPSSEFGIYTATSLFFLSFFLSFYFYRITLSSLSFYNYIP